MSLPPEVIDPRKAAVTAAAPEIVIPPSAITVIEEPAASQPKEAAAPVAPAHAAEQVQAEGEGPRNIFARGDRLADHMERVAHTAEPYAPELAAKGVKAAAAIRMASAQGRAVAGHVEEIANAVGDTADALESAGIPVRKFLRTAVTTSPLPGFGSKG